MQHEIHLHLLYSKNLNSLCYILNNADFKINRSGFSCYTVSNTGSFIHDQLVSL